MSLIARILRTFRKKTESVQLFVVCFARRLTIDALIDSWGIIVGVPYGVNIVLARMLMEEGFLTAIGNDLQSRGIRQSKHTITKRVEKENILVAQLTPDTVAAVFHVLFPEPHT